MSTYQYNCYDLVAEVRRALNDYSSAKVQATDTSGAFLNEQVIKSINDAQKHLFDILFTRVPHLFLASTTITGVASVYTLPSDFFKLRRFETSDRVKIHPMLSGVDERHLNDNAGGRYLYYRKGNTLIVDKDSCTDVNTLWYYKRPRLVTMGKVQTGGALSMTLATEARKEADYYNNMAIEDITADFTSTISDYAATRVATIASTAGTADYYGLVSELPEEFHQLIGRRAALLMKMLPGSPVPATKIEHELYKEELIEAVRSYCGDMEIGDVTPEDIFLSLEPYIP